MLIKVLQPKKKKKILDEFWPSGVRSPVAGQACGPAASQTCSPARRRGRQACARASMSSIWPSRLSATAIKSWRLGLPSRLAWSTTAVEGASTSMVAVRMMGATTNVAPGTTWMDSGHCFPQSVGHWNGEKGCGGWRCPGGRDEWHPGAWSDGGRFGCHYSWHWTDIQHPNRGIQSKSN